MPECLASRSDVIDEYPEGLPRDVNLATGLRRWKTLFHQSRFKVCA